MDAMEFLTERARMCGNYSPHCGDCPLSKENCSYIRKTKEQEEKVIAIVEQWSKEHPKKTRMSEFLKQYPNAPISEVDGLPDMGPCLLDWTLHKESICGKLSCSECREQYWTEEVK